MEAKKAGTVWTVGLDIEIFLPFFWEMVRTGLCKLLKMLPMLELLTLVMVELCYVCSESQLLAASQERR